MMAPAIFSVLTLITCHSGREVGECLYGGPLTAPTIRNTFILPFVLSLSLSLSLSHGNEKFVFFSIFNSVLVLHLSIYSDPSRSIDHHSVWENPIGESGRGWLGVEPVHERLARRQGGCAVPRSSGGRCPRARGAHSDFCATHTANHLHRWPLQMR